MEDLIESSRCFTCLTPEQVRAIQTYLLCRISGGASPGPAPTHDHEIIVPATTLDFLSLRLDSDDTKISFPNLTTFNGIPMIYDNPVLTTVDMPLLTHVAQDFNIFNNPLLSNLNIPNLIFQSNYNVQLNNNAFNETTVNFILAKAVSSGVTNFGLDLSGVGNAAPTGQGLIDKAALIAGGNTVVTN